MTTALTPRRLGLALGAVAALVAGPRLLIGLVVLRNMIAPARQPVQHTPDMVGLPYEPAAFTTDDGVMLRGWFIPRAGADGSPAPTITILHGWPWNRLGNAPGYSLGPGVPSRPVDLLAPTAAFHRAGINVLMFDLRNHGLSDTRTPVTFGQQETRDLAAAIAWLRQRHDVAGQRLGILGYSMGANTAILGIPAVQPIAAAALIQPVQPTTFAANLTQRLFGPLAGIAAPQMEGIYRLAGGPPLADIDIIAAAARLGPTAALYVQGSGDPLGRVTDTALMAKKTPGPKQVVLPETEDRYKGYQWTIDQADELVAFFQQHLG
jgi:pimeloyl-ACP methyl ester carboxylesterase